MQDLQLQLRCDLSAELAGKHWANVAIGPQGEACFVLAEPDGASVLQGYEHTRTASFPRTRMERPASVVVLIHDGHSSRQVVIADLTVAHPKVQPLPRGEVLLVGARCRRFPDGTAERNGYIYGPDGILRRTLILGDGIQDVQVDSRGAVWVSYFDEGIFGNFGWGMGQDSTPIGHAGLVRFDGNGIKLWEYEPSGEMGHMADCYALNVSGNEAWACYYTDFPLVRVTADDQVVGWSTETADVSGVSTFAVDGPRVVFFGGYPPHRNRCVLAELGTGSLKNPQECRLLLPDGQELSNWLIRGRGSELNVFSDTSWYRLDFRSVAG